MNTERIEKEKTLLGERAVANAESVTPADAPEVEMPAYDDRGMESIRRIGPGTYVEDPLTTANLGKIFVN